MRVLTIETSCDESAVSITEVKKEYWRNNSLGKIDILGDSLNSQAKLHAEFGGVYPNLAKREHVKNLVPLMLHTLLQADLLDRSESPSVSKDRIDEIREILHKEEELFAKLLLFFAQYKVPKLDAISVVRGPGLAPALWVGVNFAHALSLAWGIPIIPVNHMEGHFFSAQFVKELDFDKKEYILEKIEYPALAILLSGGHTEIVSAKEPFKYVKLGQTLDDAVGEAYDKVARLLGLGYPGGPEVSKLADDFEKSDVQRNEQIKLPRPKIKDDDLDFSFSGLKTAVLRLVESLGGAENLSKETKAEIAFEFERAVEDVVAHKLRKVLDDGEYKTLIFAGGVSANRRLRKTLSDLSKEYGIKYLVPTQALTGDNALMSALASQGRLRVFDDKNYINPSELSADGNWEIDNID